MQHNPKDPLGQRPPAAKELFQRFSREANGFPVDAALEAAMNVLLNAIRQQHPTRKGAEAAFDEMTAKFKSLLLDQHYDLMGKRRNIFPFPQVIEMPHMKLKKRG